MNHMKDKFEFQNKWANGRIHRDSQPHAHTHIQGTNVNWITPKRWWEFMRSKNIACVCVCSSISLSLSILPKASHTLAHSPMMCKLNYEAMLNEQTIDFILISHAYDNSQAIQCYWQDADHLVSSNTHTHSAHSLLRSSNSIHCACVSDQYQIIVRQ